MTEPTPPQPTVAAPTPAPTLALTPSSVRRLQDSLDRAQNLPHRPSPVDPRDANGMALTVRLAVNALPDPAMFATWIGSSHTKIALGHAVDAYREGDHARAAAWLDHVTVLLETNDIAVTHPARDYVVHIIATNAARLTNPVDSDDAADPAAGFDTPAQRHRDLLDRVADYEAVADTLRGLEFGRLGRDQLAIEHRAAKGELRVVLAGYPDRLLAEALSARLAAAESHAEAPLRDEHPELVGAYPDPLQVYRSGYVHTELHGIVDEGAYLSRVQLMREHPGVGQGIDPSWVQADTVFTAEHLHAARNILDRQIARPDPDGSTDLNLLRHCRAVIERALEDMAAASRTTTTLTRTKPIGPIPELPGPVTELGLRALIEHYEASRSELWPATRTQPVLQLRSRVEDYAQTHQVHDSPLLSDLADRDWAQQHAWTVLAAWREQAITGRDTIDLDAGTAQFAQIRTLRQHHAALASVVTNLSGDRDLPALAAALTRAHESGYDLTAHLPRLIGQADLPPEHPLRELHYRLLIDCPAALPAIAADAAPRGRDKPLPAGYRIDEAGVEDHAFYLVSTRGGQVVGAGHDRGQAEHLAHTHAAARSRAPAPPPPPPRFGPPR